MWRVAEAEKEQERAHKRRRKNQTNQEEEGAGEPAGAKEAGNMLHLDEIFKPENASTLDAQKALPSEKSGY